MSATSSVLMELVKQVVMPKISVQVAQSGSALINLWSMPGANHSGILAALRAVLESEGFFEIEGPFDVSSTLSESGWPFPDLLPEVPMLDKRVVLLRNVDSFLRNDNLQAFYSMEQEIIRPLLSSEGNIIVSSSQIPISQWSSFEIGGRVTNVHLDCLSYDLVKQIVRTHELDTEGVWSATFGFPPALEYLLDNPTLQPSEVAKFVYSSVTSDLSSEVRTLASIISLFPSLDLAVLASTDDPEKQESGYGVYLDRIRELLRHGILEWNMDSGSYRFTDGWVRRIVAYKSRIDRFEATRMIHSRAARYYQRETKHAAYLHRNFFSAVYHLAFAEYDGRTESAAGPCLQWVTDNLPYWSGAEWDAVSANWASGDSDPAARDELCQLIGSDNYLAIAKQLDIMQEQFK